MLLEGYSNFDKFEREGGDNTLSPKRKTTVVEKRKRKEEEEEKEKRKFSALFSLPPFKVDTSFCMQGEIEEEGT